MTHNALAAGRCAVCGKKYEVGTLIVSLSRKKDELRWQQYAHETCV